MADVRDKLIVALDVETFDEARALTGSLAGAVSTFKVGSQLFTACGPVVIRHLMAQGKQVFLDLKYHDIPNTVANAVISAVSLSKPVHTPLDEKGEKKEVTGHVSMLTIHTQGGEEMCIKAAQAAVKTAQAQGVIKPLILGITVLTSQSKEDNIRNLVLERARIAKNCGLDGIVASAQEVPFLRENFGNELVIVTPGIRPSGGDAGDQKRVTTPAEAIKNGSDYLVVGRPIVKADDPKAAAEAILKEIKEAK